MTAVSSAVTIVVPTRDRPDAIQLCVDTLVAHATTASADMVAVVVIDNGRSTHPPVRPTRGGVPVRVLREPRVGASRARNLGLVSSATDVVVFVDDDVTVQAGWLDALVDPLADPTVVATVGPITLDCTGGRPSWLTPDLESLYSALDLGPDTRLLGSLEHGWTANLAVRRDAACAIGGFDPGIGPGTPVPCGEDADLIDRLRAGGGGVVYAHQARVRHRVGRDRLRPRWLARRAYRQGVTEVALRDRQEWAGSRRRPMSALRSLGGTMVRGAPQLVRTARDPGRRSGLFAEQLVIASAKLGAAVTHWSPRVVGPATCSTRPSAPSTTRSGRS